MSRCLFPGPLLFAALAAADEPPGYRVDVRTPEGPVAVGEVFELEFGVEHPEEVTVAPPVLDGAGAFGVAGVTSEAESGRTVLRLRLLALALPGEHEIPSLSLEAVGADGNRLAFDTPAVPVRVVSSLPPDAGEEADIHDIRGPHPIRLPPRYGALALIAAGVLALAGLLVLLWRRRARRETPVPPLPAPEVEALSALERLAGAGLLEVGDVEGFHERLAGIMKRYAGRRFGTGWVERTTDEMLRDLRPRLEGSALHELGKVLEQADRAKFSDAHLRPNAAADCLARARSFLDRTRPAPPVEAA